MVKLRLFLMLAVIGFISVGGVFSQEKKDPTKDTKDIPIKGQLPKNWGKLGLTDEQKQTVYKTQAKYNEKIDKLKAEIKALQADEKKELDAVLTAEQKKRLIEILTGMKDTDKPKEPEKAKDK